jgi:hypothetical protein
VSLFTGDRISDGGRRDPAGWFFKRAGGRPTKPGFVQFPLLLPANTKNRPRPLAERLRKTFIFLSLEQISLYGA